MLKTIVVLVAVLAPVAAIADDHPVAEFKRDDQIVKIMSTPMLRIRANLLPLMNEKVDGNAVLRKDRIGRSHDAFWVRVRSIDGRLQCEKFAVVPPGSTEKDIAARAEELFRESCS